MEVQAGPFRADVLGKLPAAGGQPQGGQHRVQRLPGLEPPAEGPEVPGAVIGHPVRHREPGIRLPGQAHKGVALVVLQENVVTGHMALDKGILQHQGLELAGDKDRVEVIDLAHHLPGLDRMGGAVLEILADPVFQFFCLTHINDLPGFVHHQIDAGAEGQVVCFFLQLVLCHGTRLLSFIVPRDSEPRPRPAKIPAGRR